MKLNISKVLFSLIAVFLICFVCANIFNRLNNPFQTETAYKVTVNETVDIDAIAIRNEKVIESSNNGIAVYGAQNGSKVAKDAVLLEYFSTAESAVKKSKIDALSQKIDRLSNVYMQNSSYAADLDLITSSISQNLFDMLNAYDSNDFNSAENSKNELLYSLCSGRVTTGKIKKMPEKIETLKKQLNSLKSSYVQSDDYIESPNSGYFLNTVDGYENAVDFDKISELSVKDFDKIKKSDKTQNAVGKIIVDTSWYLVSKVNVQNTKRLAEGDDVRIIIPSHGSDKIRATIVAMNIDTSGDAVCVLSCTNMDAELAAIRNVKAQIVIQSHTGLRVNSKAVRVIEGKKGVYVKIGGHSKFREIDVVYSAKDYVIVNTANEDGQLKVYDDVIIKGKVDD